MNKTTFHETTVNDFVNFNYVTNVTIHENKIYIYLTNDKTLTFEYEDDIVAKAKYHTLLKRSCYS